MFEGAGRLMTLLAGRSYAVLMVTEPFCWTIPALTEGFEGDVREIPIDGKLCSGIWVSTPTEN